MLKNLLNGLGFSVLTMVGMAALLAGLAGCSPSAIPTDKSDAQKAADTMVYVKDSRTGLCFGIMSSRSVTTSLGSTSMSATVVPCDKVQDQLKLK